MAFEHRITIASIFLLGACSASGDLQLMDQKAEPIRPNSTVSIKINPLPEAGDPAVVGQLIPAVKEAFYGSLAKADGPFATVVGIGSPADYEVEIGIGELEAINPAVEPIFGFLHGYNSIAGVVNVTDNASGAILTTYSVRGESAHKSPYTAIAGGYTFDDAAQAFSDKVLEGLQ